MKINIERNDRGFAYFELASGFRGYQTRRIWCRNDMVQATKTGKEYIDFPINNGIVQVTEKGGLVIVHHVGWVVYLVRSSSGLHGTVSIEISVPTTGKSVIVATDHEFFYSGASLGESAWAIINSTGPIVVNIRRSGRWFESIHTSEEYAPDGKIEEFFFDKEVIDWLS